MAKVKVSILSPIRRKLPSLGCMTPVYNREFEEDNLLPVVRAGFVVVDAADLTPYGVDPTDVNKIKKVAPKKAAQSSGPAPQGGAPSQGGPKPGASPAAPQGGTPQAGGGHS